MIPVPPHPKKKLGQNFLQDENILRKIVEFIAPVRADSIVEIGAGTGALTARLAPLVTKLIAVELDPALIPYLAVIPDITVLQADIRKTNLCSLVPEVTVRVVGNLPYYLSTHLLALLIRQKGCIQDMTLMFQEEVANRITASSSTHEYGYLSVLTQYYCKINRGFKISRNSFFPRPDVESRILALSFRKDTAIPFPEFSSFIEIAFSQRRKKLRNNLLRLQNVSQDALDKAYRELELPADIRAENLTASRFEQLILALRSA